MRYSIPIIIVLTLMNLYHVLKPIHGDGGQPVVATKEYRFNINDHLELLKAQDEIHIQKMFLDRYRESHLERDMELAKAREEVNVLNAILLGYKEANTHRLRLTAYTARPQECNEDYKNTALMQEPTPGWTVAVSQDLKGWLGKRVYIQGFGVRRVNDLMNSRFSNAIDILVGDVAAAKAIGVRQNVLVTLIEPFALDVDKLEIESLAFIP